MQSQSSPFVQRQLLLIGAHMDLKDEAVAMAKEERRLWCASERAGETKK